MNRLSVLPLLVFGGTIGLVVITVLGRSSPWASAQPTPFERIQASCGGFHSYFVTSVFAEARSARPDLTGPAVVAFRARPDSDEAETITLARQDQVGAVYGLAYDATRGRLYAAAYHKRSTAFGPGGPGQIYEIDLASQSVRPFVQLPAGVDRHDYRTEEDAPAAVWVGRTGLADLEVDDEGTELFVMNLSDGRIYRIRLPDGTLLGSFRHGAADETWQRNAVPFGLGYADGWLYHGVVGSGLFRGSPEEFKAYVYRSRPDGSQLSLVAQFDLRYPRRPGWGWSEWTTQVPDPWALGGYPANAAQPILADLERPFGEDWVIGLRDRLNDMLPVLNRRPEFYRGVGDLLLAQPEGQGWQVFTEREHFDDWAALDESLWGSLASLPGFGITVGASLAPHAAGGLGALWNWTDSGDIAGAATLVSSFSAARSNGLGDTESLCPRRAGPAAEAPSTATSVAATATAGMPGTATAVASTPMPSGVLPRRFDRIVRESCRGDNPEAVTVCHPLWPVSVQDASATALPGVVAFRDTPNNQPLYVLAPWGAVGTTWGLAYRSASTTLYAAAYHKRGAAFGTAGPGGIYQVHVPSGNAAPFVVVPNAGRDLHDTPIASGPDTPARDWVGKVSLGDIDLADDERTLFVMNLNDRRIYRFDAATGALIDSFDHGAAHESWAADARPFALKFYRGRLYLGVVHSAESTQERGDLAAYVYQSLPNGREMRLVASVPLTYERGKVRVPAVIGAQATDVPLTWLPWRDGENDLVAAKGRFSLYPQPMLADLEFRASGDMILGLRDRHADMTLGLQVTEPTILKPGLGFGDVLLVPWRGDGWGEVSYDHFQNLGGAVASRAGMGALAGYLPFPFTLVNRVTFASGVAPGYEVNVTREVLWFDAVGNAVRAEEPCLAVTHGGGLVAACSGGQPAGSRRQPPMVARLLDDEYRPSSSMGDVEILCGPSPTPTPSPTLVAATPTPERTVVPSPSVTPTRTASPTRGPTATATPRPRPIYLPIAVRVPCVPTGKYSDVALVIDVSTSMSRTTPAGRTKLEATIEAANWLVGRMEHLSPDRLGNHEQVAIVGFNQSAWIEQELTNDRRALAAALDRLPSRLAEYTRLDLAVSAAAAATAGPKHRAANAMVIILLTDGLPNQVPLDPDGTMETTVLKAAWAAKEAGNRIYTIAIGAPGDTDPVLLRNMASAHDHYFYMPNPEDLEAVYGAIYVSIPCASTGERWP